jgi:hypothetical protein
MLALYLFFLKLYLWKKQQQRILSYPVLSCPCLFFTPFYDRFSSNFFVGAGLALTNWRVGLKSLQLPIAH